VPPASLTFDVTVISSPCPFLRGWPDGGTTSLGGGGAGEAPLVAARVLTKELLPHPPQATTLRSGPRTTWRETDTTRRRRDSDRIRDGSARTVEGRRRGEGVGAGRRRRRMRGAAGGEGGYIYGAAAAEKMRVQRKQGTTRRRRRRRPWCSWSSSACAPSRTPAAAV
jgi:uncharacterized protein YcfJ